MPKALIFLVCSLVFPLLPAAAAESPSWSEWQQEQQIERPLRISRYFKGHKGDPNTVLVDGGAQAGVRIGTSYKVVRQGYDHDHARESTKVPMWVELGRVKVIETQEQMAVAVVESEGSLLARAVFPKFPHIMAGDFLITQRVSITRNQLAVPHLALGYRELFADPKPRPASFELRADGYQKLREAAASLASLRLGVLMVEGYTDARGPADENQIESYQRALTVRQFLVDELGFDDKRVIAVGYGEAEPADASASPGADDANRRIVLKAMAPSYVPTPKLTP